MTRRKLEDAKQDSREGSKGRFDPSKMLLESLTEELPGLVQMTLPQYSGFLEVLEKNPGLIPNFRQKAERFVNSHPDYSAVIRATLSYLDQYQKDHTSETPSA